LFFAMCISILLGMGMPTTAAYAVAASVVAPGLVQLGIPILTAHFFVFYFRGAVGDHTAGRPRELRGSRDIGGEPHGNLGRLVQDRARRVHCAVHVLLQRRAAA
jgi:hypothetical protein